MDSLPESAISVGYTPGMQIEGYRLWERWQQMHYPMRGLPADEAISADLVDLDGTAGVVLEKYFCRGSEAKTLDVESRAALQRCHDEIHSVSGELFSDADRYFGRLLDVIDLALADAPSMTARGRTGRR